LEADCFGGKTTTETGVFGNRKNYGKGAYLLVYQRKGEPVRDEEGGRRAREEGREREEYRHCYRSRCWARLGGGKGKTKSQKTANFREFFPRLNFFIASRVYRPLAKKGCQQKRQAQEDPLTGRSRLHGAPKKNGGRR
jgi:hypothetical protein